MAKRKRLTPPQTDYLSALPALETKAWLRPGVPPPPIAQVASDVAQAAALAEVAQVLQTARAEGLLVQRLPLEAVDAGYLVRDRLGQNPEEMAALIESLRSNGQRTPIEVAEIAPGRYGLISGWRRLNALRHLRDSTQDSKFDTVLALLRRPETAGAAYVAMVEENEIRLGLSYYERARIVAKAVEQGVFNTDRAALQALFAAASRAKRSKIGSFLTIFRALDGVLLFPAALPERLGLALSHALETQPGLAARIAADLRATPPARAEDELARLSALLARSPKNAVSEPVTAAQAEEIRSGVFLTVEGGWTKPILILKGPNVGPEFRERLENWLKNP